MVPMGSGVGMGVTRVMVTDRAFGVSSLVLCHDDEAEM